MGGGLDRRLHAYKGQVRVGFTEPIQRGSGGGVARDDYQATVLFDEEIYDARREGADFLRRARTIWTIFLVRKVNEVVMRQCLSNRAEYGQTPYARVEQTDSSSACSDGECSVGGGGRIGRAVFIFLHYRRVRCPRTLRTTCQTAHRLPRVRDATVRR